MPVVVTNTNVATADEMARIFEAVHLATGKNEAVLIANNIEHDALQTIVQNWVEKRFFVLPLRVVAYGETGEGALRDVAAVTGATFIDASANMYIKDLTQDDLGTAAKVVASKHETLIVTEDAEAKDGRVEDLRLQLEVCDREFERESLRERIAKLRSAMFTIKVGGVTDTERQERKLRVEDAVKATKAALTDGVVSGGGTALYRAAIQIATRLELTGQTHGLNAVIKACQRPLEQMAINSGLKLDRSDLEEILDPTKAIDFRTGEVVHALNEGILDPAKVVSSALKHASAEAALFLVTEAVVVTKDRLIEEAI